MITNATPAVSSNGTYVGNDTANRAIPHGLGRIPKLVTIFVDGSDALMFAVGATIKRIGSGELAVTAADATNFYVGNAAGYPQTANAAAGPYSWCAT